MRGARYGYACRKPFQQRLSRVVTAVWSVEVGECEDRVAATHLPLHPWIVSTLCKAQSALMQPLDCCLFKSRVPNPSPLALKYHSLT